MVLYVTSSARLIWHCIKVPRVCQQGCRADKYYDADSNLNSDTAERYEDNYGVLQSVKICAYDVNQ